MTEHRWHPAKAIALLYIAGVVAWLVIAVIAWHAYPIAEDALVWAEHQWRYRDIAPVFEGADEPCFLANEVECLGD